MNSSMLAHPVYFSRTHLVEASTSRCGYPKACSRPSIAAALCEVRDSDLPRRHLGGTQGQTCTSREKPQQELLEGSTESQRRPSHEQSNAMTHRNIVNSLLLVNWLKQFIRPRKAHNRWRRIKTRPIIQQMLHLTLSTIQNVNTKEDLSLQGSGCHVYNINMDFFY